GYVATGLAGGSGHLLQVLSGGTARNTTIGGGGSATVRQNGVASTTTVLSGGGVTVSGGRTVSTTLSGGRETVLSGGASSQTIVLSGGIEDVRSGGTAKAPVIGSGGSAVIEGGATVQSPVISGGNLVLDAGYKVTGPFAFAAGTSGTLTISGTVMPTDTISGFITGDAIDLAGVSYSSASTVSRTAQNELVISANGHAYDLFLDPSQSFAGDSFLLSNDGHGGTKVTDPPAAPGHAAALAPAFGFAHVQFTASGPSGGGITGSTVTGGGSTAVALATAQQHLGTLS